MSTEADSLHSTLVDKDLDARSEATDDFTVVEHSEADTSPKEVADGPSMERKTAHVVLPTADSDEDDEPEEEIPEDKEEDFLADYPDDTEASEQYCYTSRSFLFIVILRILNSYILELYL